MNFHRQGSYHENIQSQSIDDPLPNELEKIVESIDSDLSENQKNSVRQLLSENLSVFSSKE